MKTKIEDLNIQALTIAVSEVAPVDGIRRYKGSVIIDFKESATEAQKLAAKQVIDTWTNPPENPDDRVWRKFYVALTNSSLWAHIKGQSAQSLGANTAFTVLMVEVTVMRRIEHFAQSWAEFRSNLEKDFNQGQLDEMAALLQRHGFDTELFDLAE